MASMVYTSCMKFEMFGSYDILNNRVAVAQGIFISVFPRLDMYFHSCNHNHCSCSLSFLISQLSLCFSLEKKFAFCNIANCLFTGLGFADNGAQVRKEGHYWVESLGPGAGRIRKNISTADLIKPSRYMTKLTSHFQGTMFIVTKVIPEFHFVSQSVKNNCHASLGES